MSMFGSALLVSIPGAALDGIDLPGSIFGREVLATAALPPELRCALGLVEQACDAAGTTLRFVARPEIFTHGAARAWLEARLDGAADHLALSDGQTLRTIPGLRNHVFFHARGVLRADEARRRLLALAPELFANLASQVNGALSVRLGKGVMRPPTTLLRGAPAPADPGPLLAFGIPFRAADRVAALLADAAPVPLPPGPLHFVPLSTRALADGAFVWTLARMIQRSAVGAQAPLLIGLPRLDRPDADPRERIAALLAALIATELALPRALTRSIMLAEGDPLPEMLAGGRVTLHAAFPFWRFAPALFERAAEVEVTGDGRLGPARQLLAAWSGRRIGARPPDPRLPELADGGVA
ncbi:hypothetical protein [Falsiroseomonas sp. HW251]|uniref:hypothetical protein n=1 Tax=Falsiroseomonas sp. HW251 TaxID=3390998 RepID=UPI003D31C75B